MTIDLGFMDLDLGLALAGIIVGFVVGLTGMGGGALMTPILILFFGIDPLSAVSSDLVVSLCMKPIGAAVHLRRGTVNMNLVKWLVIGSVPAAFAGVLILKALGESDSVENFIKVALGVALLLSVATMAGKAAISLRQYYRERAAGIVGQSGVSLFGITIRPIPTLIIGVLGGVVVGMTSVGSGSLIIVGLLLLYPTLRAGDLVGTDLVQAVPLVGAAALGHILFGDFSLAVTTSLLVGALPGVYMGARVSSRGQGGLIRRALVLVLFASGLKLIGLDVLWVTIGILAMVVLGPVFWALVRNTEGFQRRPHQVEGVPAWRLVWAAASGVPPRYQGHRGPAEPKGEQPEGEEWDKQRSAADPL
jgi:uncharacterized membrane protein YfcA